MCCVLGMGRKKALEGHPNGPNPMMDGQPDSCMEQVSIYHCAVRPRDGQATASSDVTFDASRIFSKPINHGPFSMGEGEYPFPEYTILTRRHVDHLENAHHTKDSHLATSISSPKSNHWPFPEVNDTNILSLLNSSCKLYDLPMEDNKNVEIGIDNRLRRAKEASPSGALGLIQVSFNSHVALESALQIHTTCFKISIEFPLPRIHISVVFFMPVWCIISHWAMFSICLGEFLPTSPRWSRRNACSASLCPTAWRLKIPEPNPSAGGSKCN